MFLALYWLKSIPDQALNEASISALVKLNAVLPEHRQNLLQQTTIRAFNVWLAVNQILVEQVRVSIRS